MERPIVVVATAALAVGGCTGAEVPAAQPATPRTSAPAMTPTSPPPPPPLAWGPTLEQYERAADLVALMSVEERAGQVLVADYATVGSATALVSDLHLGGVIVMGDNVASTDQLQARVAKSCGRSA